MGQVTQGHLDRLRRQQSASRDKDISAGAFGLMAEAEQASGWRFDRTASSSGIQAGSVQLQLTVSPSRREAEEGQLATSLSESLLEVNAAMRGGERALQGAEDLPKLTPFQCGTLESLSDGLNRASALVARLRTARLQRRVEGAPLTRASTRALQAEATETAESLTELSQALAGALRTRQKALPAPRE